MNESTVDSKTTEHFYGINIRLDTIKWVLMDLQWNYRFEGLPGLQLPIIRSTCLGWQINYLDILIYPPDQLNMSRLIVELFKLLLISIILTYSYCQVSFSLLQTIAWFMQYLYNWNQTYIPITMIIKIYYCFTASKWWVLW